MKLSVPNNWQEDLLVYLGKKREFFSELYGRLPFDLVGSSDLALSLSKNPSKVISKSIERIHRDGLEFNYLLDSNCLNNLEWGIRWRNKFIKFSHWLAEIKVDSVTVAIPYLFEIMKKRHPGIKIVVSLTACVDSIERARFWESLGADKIVLRSIDINRNFNLLDKIRRAVRCKLELVVNLNCLYNCPFHMYHCYVNSHISQDVSSRTVIPDYSQACWNYQRFSDPVNFIRADWIRPEDLHYYEGLGIDEFKIAGMNMAAEEISLIADAYIRRDYEGNLLDLFPRRVKKELFTDPQSRISDGIHPGNFFIDNKKLNGFLDHFLSHDCDPESCDECGYCGRIAAEAVRSI